MNITFGYFSGDAPSPYHFCPLLAYLPTPYPTVLVTFLLLLITFWDRPPITLGHFLAKTVYIPQAVLRSRLFFINSADRFHLIINLYLMAWKCKDASCHPISTTHLIHPFFREEHELEPIELSPLAQKASFFRISALLHSFVTTIS